MILHLVSELNSASIDSISKYLPRLLTPEVIFHSTIKARVVRDANLSLSQWDTVGSLILLMNISPTLRKATAKLSGNLSFVIATEIALINADVLVSILSYLRMCSIISSAKVCSWISHWTTLQPLKVVI